MDHISRSELWIFKFIKFWFPHGSLQNFSFRRWNIFFTNIEIALVDLVYLQITKKPLDTTWLSFAVEDEIKNVP